MSERAIDRSDSFGAEPLATALMSTGAFDKAAFQAAYGAGHSPSSEEFGFRFACSLGTQAAKWLESSNNPSMEPSDNPDLAVVFGRFAKGATSLDDDLFGFAIQHLKLSVAQARPSWTHFVGKRHLLTTQAKKTIAWIVANDKDFTAEKRNVLIDSMGDAGSFGPEAAKLSDMLARAKAEHLKSEIDAHAGPAHPGAKTARI